MVDRPNDARVGGGELVGDPTGRVARAVVDDDDLELSASPGSVARASATRPSRFASSLWAGKKYDSGASRSVTGRARWTGRRVDRSAVVGRGGDGQRLVAVGRATGSIV